MKKLTTAIIGITLGTILFMTYQLHQFNAKNDALIEAYQGYTNQLEQTEMQMYQTEQTVNYFMDKLGIEQMEATGYSPSDGIEGMCYSGNPNVTASGGKPIPGETIAAGPSVPFGTKMYIEGLGFRTVNDRGSMITDNHVDIVFESRKQALQYGRQKVNVMVVKQPL